MESKSYLLWLQLNKGYHLKQVVDMCSRDLTRVCLSFDASGMKLYAESDIIGKEGRALFDALFSSQYISGYICQKPINVSVNIEHLEKLLKNNVKRNNSITMYIDKDAPTTLSIEVGSNSDLTPIMHIKFHKTKVTSGEDEHLTDESYNKPIKLSSANMKKIKDAITTSRKIRLKIQGNKYIEFASEENDAYATGVTKGTVDKTKSMYTDIFDKEAIVTITKMSAVTDEVRVYAPKEPTYPVKFSCTLSYKTKRKEVNKGADVNVLGTYNIYLNSITTLDASRTDVIEDQPSAKGGRKQ